MEYTPLHTVITTVKLVLKDQPDLYSRFEDSIRYIIASDDLHALMSGKISNTTIFHSIRNSLEQLSNDLYERDMQHLATMCYNPVTNTLLDIVEKQLIHISNTDLTLSATNNRQSSSKSPRNTRISPSSSPRPTKMKKKPSKDTITKDKEPSIDTIHSQLEAFIVRNPAPYINVEHIKCSILECKFCTGMFRHIKLTKCVDHKPCVQAGWFPHVGRPLWSSLKHKHGQTREFVGHTTTCKTHELPSLGQSIAISVDNIQLDDVDETLSRTAVSNEYSVSELSDSWSNTVNAEYGDAPLRTPSPDPAPHLKRLRSDHD